VLGGVFICYRREDSAGFARLIYDRLTSKLGRDGVFFDVDNIAPGLDFVDILSERVGKCDALIAVIGKNWASSADVHDRRRLDDPNDFVRIEIEAALARKVRVIPVLVDGAPMPRPAGQPQETDAPTRYRDFSYPLRFRRRKAHPDALPARGGATTARRGRGRTCSAREARTSRGRRRGSGRRSPTTGRGRSKASSGRRTCGRPCERCGRCDRVNWESAASQCAWR
jgi:TIR domain